MGCQRSGTSMLIETLALAPEILTYPEGTNLALKRYRLREADRVEAVIRRGPSPLCAMKPICDAHLTDVLLAQHHGSSAIWIYRDPRDVARSAIRKWGDHQLQLIRLLQQGRFHELGWRGERISPSVLDVVNATEVRTPEDGAGLYWWVRNQVPFELGLVDDPRVLLVRYESLVADPPGQLHRIFGFLGAPTPAAALDHLHHRSVGGAALDALDPAIEALALAHLDRLDEALATAGGRG